MKKNEAFANFLDEKYIPLDFKYKILIIILIFTLPCALYYFFFLKPNLEDIEKLKRSEAKLERELKNVIKKSKDLPKFQAELAATQETFDQKAELLPRQKEIPQLLRDISSLGRAAGLDFLKFKPQGSKPKDFYSEIPITINVRGPYHNVGFFFDRVSKLQRIVSVTNIKMTSPKKEKGEMLLKSDCRLVTYQFTNKPLPKKNSKKKKKKK